MSTFKPTERNPAVDGKAIRTLARSIHRQMRDAGYSTAQVVDFASTVLDLVCERVRNELKGDVREKEAAE